MVDNTPQPCKASSQKGEQFESLAKLALNVSWSWNHSSDEIWRQLDLDLWDLTHNPWAVLQTASRDRIAGVFANRIFRERVDGLIDASCQAAEAPAWFQKKHAQTALTGIAYFSMEFMLSEALPIYSGGLGNVAGDQMKAASGLGVPLTGVGLLYQQGYFRQVIDRDGAQQALYPYNDPGQLPITPVRQPNGEWLRLQLALPGYSIWLRAWQAQVGRVKLYLLDSNDVANFPAHRGITSELYGGGPELRLQQELLLGIGGWRLLRALGIQPEVCHLNEGARRVRRSGTGSQLHGADERLLRGGARRHPGRQCVHDAYRRDRRFRPLFSRVDRAVSLLVCPREVAHLRKRPAGPGPPNSDSQVEDFNMAYLAMHGSGAVNGVSRLHGQVSRRMFLPLFPRWPENEIPVHHVINGIHMPTWDSAAADALWTEACGKHCWLGPSENMEEEILRVPEASIWQLRTAARECLVGFARGRLSQQLAVSGASPEAIEAAMHLFDPNTLTLGFARRFATYKRPNLLLHDPERLLRLLTSSQRPVQLIIAGKAHPADLPGQALIQEWMRFIRRAEARSHVVFLSDYDMLLTEQLVQGADVWINTPRRPWEACGTSGMKVLVNGGLNLSELDGWWAEAYTPEVGWALGDGQEHGDDPAWDAADAEALYSLLEREVVPEFYYRDQNGIPSRWVARVRASMARLTPQFSASRAVREYTENYYLPAAKTYCERAADKSRSG